MFSYQTKQKERTGTTVQPKLKIGQPGDKYEREADAVADRVMMMSETESLQMQPMEEEEEELMPKLRMQPMEEEEEIVQANSKSVSELSPDLTNQLNSTQGKGNAMPQQTNKFMSNAIGSDFSGVKIHTGQESIQMNQQLGARAFTHGNDIYFNNGEFRPDNNGGKRLLAHELTHVAQQNTDLKKTKSQLSNTNSNNLLQTKEDLIQRDGGTTAAVAALAYTITSEVLSSSGGGSDIDLNADEMTGMYYSRSASAAGTASRANSTTKTHVFSYLLESLVFRSNLIELTLRMDYEVDSFGVGNISFAIETIDDAAGWGGRFTVNLTPMDSLSLGAVRLTVSFDTSGFGSSASGSFTYWITPIDVYKIREVGDTGDYLGMQDSHSNSR